MPEAPPEDTIVGLRDRATLSVGLGRAEIAALTSHWIVCDYGRIGQSSIFAPGPCGFLPASRI